MLIKDPMLYCSHSFSNNEKMREYEFGIISDKLKAITNNTTEITTNNTTEITTEITTNNTTNNTTDNTTEITTEITTNNTTDNTTDTANEVFELYTTEILNTLNKTELENILIQNTTTTKSFDRISKVKLIDMILKDNIKYDVVKRNNELKQLEEKNKQDELIKKQKQDAIADAKLKKKMEDDEKKRLKKIEEEEQKRLKKIEEDEKKRLKKNEEEEQKRLKKIEEEEQKRLKKNEEREQKELKKSLEGVPNLVDSKFFNNQEDTKKLLKANEFTNPYFRISYKIPKHLSNQNNQKVKFDIVDYIRNKIMNYLKIKEDAYNNSVHCITTESNDSQYWIFQSVFIMKNYKVFPYNLKKICTSFTNNKLKYNITIENIYEEGFDLQCIKARKENDNTIVNCYDICDDDVEIVLFNNFNDDNCISKKVLDKSVVITEYIDRNALNYIINNIEKVATFCYEHNEIVRGGNKMPLKAYIELIEKQVNQYAMYFNDFNEYKKNSIKVSNRPIEGFEGCRKYSVKKHTKQTLPRPIRHMLGKSLVKDVDMCKAHFKILLNLINTKDYIDASKCKTLISFINDIDNSFAIFQKEFPKMSKSNIKMILISILFNDGIDKEKHLFKNIELFKDFVDEIYYIQDVIYDNNENYQLIKNSEKDVEIKLAKAEQNGEDDDVINKIKRNPRGKALARILQKEENTILECMLKYCNEKGIVYSTLQYDGFEVVLPEKYNELGLKLPHKNFKLDDDLLRDMEAYINKEVDYEIGLSYKELDEGMILPADYIYSLERIYILDNMNDTITANLIIDLIKHNVKKRIISNDNYELLFKKDYIYIRKEDDIKRGIEDFIQNANIYRFFKLKNPNGDVYDKNRIINDLFNDDYDTYKGVVESWADKNINSNSKFVEALTKYIYGNIIKSVEDITDKIENSTLNKLCFNDGVYFFNDGNFYKWGNPETNNIYSTIKINRNFPNLDEMSDDNRDNMLELIDFLDKQIKNCYKPENYNELTLRYEALARIVSGNVVDKCWMLVFGVRNSYKSLEVDLLRSSFGNYIGTMEVESFLDITSSKDTAMDNYLFGNHIDKRMICISEGHEEDTDKKFNVKYKSKIIKNISGGDMMETRGKYKADIYYHKPSYVLGFYCNNAPKFTNCDVFNNCLYMRADYGFLDKNNEEFNDVCYKEPIYYGDDNLDLKVYINNNIAFKDAFLLLIIKHYKASKVVASEKMISNLNLLRECSGQVSYINDFLKFVKPSNDSKNLKIRVHKKFFDNDLLEYILDKAENEEITFPKNFNKASFKPILLKLNLKAVKGTLEGFKNPQHHYKVEILNNDIKSKYDEWIITSTENGDYK